MSVAEALTFRAYAVRAGIFTITLDLQVMLVSAGFDNLGSSSHSRSSTEAVDTACGRVFIFQGWCECLG